MKILCLSIHTHILFTTVVGHEEMPNINIKGKNWKCKYYMILNKPEVMWIRSMLPGNQFDILESGRLALQCDILQDVPLLVGMFLDSFTIQYNVHTVCTMHLRDLYYGILHNKTAFQDICIGNTFFNENFQIWMLLFYAKDISVVIITQSLYISPWPSGSRGQYRVTSG